MAVVVAVATAAGKVANKPESTVASFLAMCAPTGIVPSMSPREKARLYHELGQLVQSGVPFPRAVEKLAAITRGKSHRVLSAIGAAIGRGASIAEALAAGEPFIAPLETGIFIASDRAGRLENGLAHAAEYYGAIGEARGRMRSRAAYPLFVLHLAFVALSLPRVLAPDGGMDAFIKAVVLAVGGFWLGGFIVVTLLRAVLSAAERNASVDRLLWPIPVFGKLRSTFALSRFCAAYNLQIDAGVNVLASLDIAGRASGSAVIREAAERSLPAVRSGGSVGTALAATRTFPEPFVRAFAVGEETGQLDQELRRLADEYRTTAFRLLETISDWLPKIVFLCVAIYIGYRVVAFYWGYIKQIQDVLKG